MLPVLQDQPFRSGRTLHSSPSIHGCIWHHHFWATMEAGAANGGLEEKKDSRLIKGRKDVVKSTELTTSTRQTDNHYPHNNSVILSDGLGMLKGWGQEKSGAPAVCRGGTCVQKVGIHL